MFLECVIGFGGLLLGLVWSASVFCLLSVILPLVWCERAMMLACYCVRLFWRLFVVWPFRPVFNVISLSIHRYLVRCYACLPSLKQSFTHKHPPRTCSLAPSLEHMLPVWQAADRGKGQPWDQGQQWGSAWISISFNICSNPNPLHPWKKPSFGSA